LIVRIGVSALMPGRVIEARDAAKARREALDRGEDVPGGLRRRESTEEMLRHCGWTMSDIRDAQRLAVIGDLVAGMTRWRKFINGAARA
jgi:hypothetical protein